MRNKNHPNQKLKQKLTRDEQLQVCVWFAEMRDLGQIDELVQSRFGKKLSKVALWEYKRRPKWAKVISFLKERFKKNLASIPIANKEVRLKRLERIYELSLTPSLKSRDQFGNIYEIKLGNAAQVLREARVEMEGEKPLVDNSTHTHTTLIQVMQKAAEQKKEKEEMGARDNLLETYGGGGNGGNGEHLDD